MEQSKKEHMLRVGVYDFPPFVMRDQRGVYEGFDIDLWEALAERNDWQYQYEAATTDEILEKLETNQIDIGLGNLALTHQYERRIDFSHSIFETGLHIAVRARSGYERAGIVWRSIFSEATIRILALFLFFIILAAHVVWLADKGAGNIAADYSVGIFDSFWLMIQTVTTVGYGDLPPVSSAAKWVSGIVMFFSMIITAVLAGSIASGMTVRKLSSGIQHHRDLLGKRVAIRAEEELVHTLHQLDAHPVVVYSVDEALEELTEGNVDAVVADAGSLLYHAHEDLTGSYEIVGDLFAAREYGIALQQPSSLRENLNRSLLQLREDGTYEEIFEKWFGEME